MFEYPSKSDYQYKILASYGGEPFLLVHDFYNYYDAQQYLVNMINTTDKRYRYNFYVDNKFYKNNVPLGFPKQRYYKIIKRKISNFIDADYDLPKLDDNISSNNILQFVKSY